MKEIWKDVKGFEGIYKVSSMGNVKSLDRRVPHKNLGSQFVKGRILKKANDKVGYLIVGLSKNGTNRNFKVHRLVCYAFLVNPQNKAQVNHLNGIKSDNRVENLQWSTAQENSDHAWQTGLKSGEKLKGIHSKLSDYDVRCIKVLLRKGCLTNAVIASLFNISGSHVSGINTGNKRWQVSIRPT